MGRKNINYRLDFLIALVVRKLINLLSRIRSSFYKLFTINKLSKLFSKLCIEISVWLCTYSSKFTHFSFKYLI